MLEIGQMIGALLVVLCSFLGIALLARRFMPQLVQRYQPGGALQQLGLLTLTPHCSVALIRAGQETLVLGLTPQAVTLLAKTHEEGMGDWGLGVGKEQAEQPQSRRETLRTTEKQY
jgi:flagellar biogenesis protein FliO